MMNRREANLALLSGAVLAAAPGLAVGQEAPIRALPPPRSDGGQPLLRALNKRRSVRDYSSQPLPPQVLSDLLWAAFGINRPESGDRTAPSWRHAIEIEILAATADGVWRYEPGPHRLTLHVPGDIRAQTGMQDFVGTAPLDLIYVADGARMKDASREDQRLYAYTDTGFIGQNVYLFCASEGLASVFRGSVDRDALARTLKLTGSRFITYAQTVGYPRS